MKNCKIFVTLPGVEQSQVVLDKFYLFHCEGVLRGSVVKWSTGNPGRLGSSRTRSSGFFVGVSFGKILQIPSLVLVKARKDLNSVI